MDHFVKFRAIKPRSTHLNGKVERSQLTHKGEFHSTIFRKVRTLELAVKLLECMQPTNYILSNAHSM